MSDSAPRPPSDEVWDNLVRQLPGSATARPRPFFYGRVRARLDARAAAESPALPHWLRRPAYAALLGALALALSGDGLGLRPAAQQGSAPPGAPAPR